MNSKITDVWNVRTFDKKLGAILAQEHALIRNYAITDREIFLCYDLGRNPDRPIAFPAILMAERMPP